MRISYAFANLYCAVGLMTDYCGRSEIPEHPDNSSDPVWIFFRHGSRTDFHETNCFPKKEQTKFTCSMRTGFYFASGSGLVKSYGDCQVGQLLDYAEVQMNRLGIYLAKTYSNVFSNPYLRSTDTQRTLGSLDLLLAGSATQSEQVVEVKEFDSDSLNLNTPNCPRATWLNEAFQTSKSYLDFIDSDEFSICSKMWKSEIGTDFSLSDSGDCLLTARCANVNLPGGLVPSVKLNLCVETLFSKIRQLKYGYVVGDSWTPLGKEFCQLAVFPFLHELSRNRSSLIATHDDTLACLLSAWGLWDGVWPKYGSFITVEMGRTGFKILRDGIEIKDSVAKLAPFDNETSWNEACQTQRTNRLVVVSM